jgi:hypothetical protein
MERDPDGRVQSSVLLTVFQRVGACQWRDGMDRPRGVQCHDRARLQKRQILRNVSCAG